MKKEKVTVAVDFGSSKISAAAAKKKSDGSLDVIAYASLPSSSFIRNGCVYNIDLTAEAIVQLVDRLEKQLDAKITRVFSGVGGKSLRAVPVTIHRSLEEGTVITSEMVGEMEEECSNTITDNMLQLLIPAAEFRVDHKTVSEQNPTGVVCSYVEGCFQRVMIRPKLYSLFNDSFVKSGLEVADCYVTPVEVADRILTDDEKQRGCALIDYGADTTTLSVFKNGQLCYLRVLPLGSDTITRDIMNVFKLSHEAAESLKLTYGLFNLSDSTEENAIADNTAIPLKQLGDVISARNEEILLNIKHLLSLSEYHDMLYAGIVLTGGGCNLKKLISAMSQIFPDLHPVRICSEVPFEVRWKDPMWSRADGTGLSLLSLLSRGDEDCCEFPEMDMTKEPTPEEESRMQIGNLFDDEGECAQPELNIEDDGPDDEEAGTGEEETAPKRRHIDGILKRLRNFIDEVQ